MFNLGSVYLIHVQFIQLDFETVCRLFRRIIFIQFISNVHNSFGEKWLLMLVTSTLTIRGALYQRKAGAHFSCNFLLPKVDDLFLVVAVVVTFITPAYTARSII